MNLPRSPPSRGTRELVEHWPDERHGQFPASSSRTHYLSAMGEASNLVSITGGAYPPGPRAYVAPPRVGAWYARGLADSNHPSVCSSCIGSFWSLAAYRYRHVASPRIVGPSLEHTSPGTVCRGLSLTIHPSLHSPFFRNHPESRPAPCEPRLPSSLTLYLLPVSVD